MDKKSSVLERLTKTSEVCFFWRRLIGTPSSRILDWWLGLRWTVRLLRKQRGDSATVNQYKTQRLYESVNFFGGGGSVVHLVMHFGGSVHFLLFLFLLLTFGAESEVMDFFFVWCLKGKKCQRQTVNTTLHSVDKLNWVARMCQIHLKFVSY